MKLRYSDDDEARRDGACRVWAGRGIDCLGTLYFNGRVWVPDPRLHRNIERAKARKPRSGPKFYIEGDISQIRSDLTRLFRGIRTSAVHVVAEV